MKKSFFLSAFILLLLQFSNAQKNFSFPNNINSSDVFVTSIIKDVVTIKARKGFELWQFKLGSNEIVKHFKLTPEFEKAIFNSYFNDNGAAYEKVKRQYETNNLKAFDYFIQINNYLVNDNNEVFALVKCLEAKTENVGNPNGDISMKTFYMLIKVDNEKISESIGIQDMSLESGYFVIDNDFFIKENEFFFTVSKTQTSEKENYFIGKWVKSSNKLIFSNLLKLELPEFHIKQHIGYGLMNFMTRKNLLIFYSCPYLYDLNRLTCKKLEVQNIKSSQFTGHKKGDFFDINFSVCALFDDGATLKLIIRQNINFFIEEYDSKTLLFKKEIPMTDYTFDNLHRFPFFNSNGQITITPKKSGDIIILTH